MSDFVTILKGIVLILSSIFILEVCIISSSKSFFEFIALGLFVIGLITCLVGFHNVKIELEANSKNGNCK